MAQSTIQRSFAGGELAPALHARADTVKYATGLKTCRNFAVKKAGGLENRAGTEFICEVKDSTKAVRLLKFVFNAEQSYILEFGDQYMRVIRDGAPIEVSGVSAWSNATAYEIGDLVVHGGVNYYCVADSSNNEPPNASYWYALTGSIYEIPTPYLEADLRSLYTSQSADVVTITCQGYRQRELRRYAHTEWILEQIEFLADMERPTGISIYATPPNDVYQTYTRRYRVTAIQEGTFRESLTGLGVGKTISAATKANPCQLTITGHGFEDNQTVELSEVLGMTELNGQTVTITKIDANTVTIGIDSTGYSTYTSGGKAAPTYVFQGTSAIPDESQPTVLSWTAVPGAFGYNVYLNVSGVYAFLGQAVGTTFNDIGFAGDLTITQPLDRNPFEDIDDCPAICGLYQQRQLFGNSVNHPERVDASRIGDFHNFTNSSPQQDDDAFDFSMIGRQVNEVRHLIDLDKLVILTSGGEWVAEGDSDGVFKPTAPNLRQKGYTGSAAIPPVIVGNTILFVQARGSIVRDFKFDGLAYQGRDLTIFATHLFEGKTITAWDFAQNPNSIIWVVVDGQLVGLTYLPEHEIWGWHRHDTGVLDPDDEDDTGDTFEDVCVIPEGTEDVAYFVVKRTIDGTDRRYIERMKTRLIQDVDDAFFVDSGLTYDGRNTGATTMTLTGGTDWNSSEDLTLTASVSYFASGDVGNAVVLPDPAGGADVRLTITAYASGTVVTVRTDRDVPAGLRSTAVTDFSLAVDQFAELDHLEGRSVAILADGEEKARQTVTGGEITLDRPYSVVHIGLPIVADAQTLDIDIADGRVIRDKKKLIARVTMDLEKSRGGKAGTDATHLREIRPPKPSQMNSKKPYTDQVEVQTSGNFDSNGRVFVRQDSPLPMTILSIVPMGAVSAE